MIIVAVLYRYELHAADPRFIPPLRRSATTNVISSSWPQSEVLRINIQHNRVHRFLVRSVHVTEPPIVAVTLIIKQRIEEVSGSLRPV